MPSSGQLQPFDWSGQPNAPLVGPGLRLAAVVRRMLIVIAAGAALLLDPRASQAYEKPWCALTEIAGGAMYENCTIPTFELCVQEVIAGNRGFCIPNPRWQARAPAAARPAKACRLLRGRFHTQPAAPAASGPYCSARRLWIRACARGLLLGGVVVSMHAQPAET